MTEEAQADVWRNIEEALGLAREGWPSWPVLVNKLVPPDPKKGTKPRLRVQVDTDPLLTVKQVAERLQLNEKTIRRWIAAGKLRGVWLGTDRAGWRIRQSDLAEVLQGERPAEQTRQLRLAAAKRRAD